MPGEAHQTAEPMQTATRPPEREDGRGPLNSIVALTVSEGGCVEYREAIVFERCAALPQFAIWYRHLESCRCTHCVMTICVKLPNGDDIQLDVFGNTMIQELKELIQATKGTPTNVYPARAQHIFYEHKDIPNEVRLRDLGIKDGSFVLMSLWPSGGGHVFVKTLKGEQYKIPCNEVDTVWMLKEKIALVEGILPEDQRFTSPAGSSRTLTPSAMNISTIKLPFMFCTVSNDGLGGRRNWANFIKTLTAKLPLTINCTKFDTIYKLKEKFQEKEGIPPIANASSTMARTFRRRAHPR